MLQTTLGWPQTYKELKSTVTHASQNTEPNLRRFTVAKYFAVVVKRSKISLLPLSLRPMMRGGFLVYIFMPSLI